MGDVALTPIRPAVRVVVRATKVSAFTGCHKGRRVYSDAIPGNNFEGSTADRTVTRNATPLRLGGR